MIPFGNQTQTLDRDREPVIGLLLDLGPQAEPVFAFGRRAEESADVVTVVAVGLLDPPVAKGQLSHPVYSAPNSSWQTNSTVSSWLAVKTVVGEVVGGQILAVVVRGDVVYVGLVAVLCTQVLLFHYLILKFSQKLNGVLFCYFENLQKCSREF